MPKIVCENITPPSSCYRCFTLKHELSNLSLLIAKKIEIENEIMSRSQF